MMNPVFSLKYLPKRHKGHKALLWWQVGSLWWQPFGAVRAICLASITWNPPNPLHVLNALTFEHPPRAVDGTNPYVVNEAMRCYYFAENSWECCNHLVGVLASTDSARFAGSSSNFKRQSRLTMRSSQHLQSCATWSDTPSNWEGIALLPFHTQQPKGDDEKRIIHKPMTIIVT